MTDTLTATTTLVATETAASCATAPDVPPLLSPDERAVITTKRPTFEWAPTACADSYRVVIRDSSGKLFCGRTV